MTMNDCICNVFADESNSISSSSAAAAAGQQRLVSTTTDPSEDPTSSPRQCTADRFCLVFNCPFGNYPSTRNRTCVSLTDLKPLIDETSAFTAASLRSTYGLDKPPGNVVEYFLNFAFVIGSSINAVKFVPPRVMVLPGEDAEAWSDRYATKCPPDEQCRSQGCVCTNVKQLRYNDTVQVGWQPMA